MLREVGRGKDINDGEKISPGEMEMLYFIARAREQGNSRRAFYRRADGQDSYYPSSGKIEPVGSD